MKTALIVLAALTVGPEMTPLHPHEGAFRSALTMLNVCVVKSVRRSPKAIQRKHLNKLITRALIKNCLYEARGMVDAYNRLKGEGGEDYFVGQYLDELPALVQKRLEVQARP